MNGGRRIEHDSEYCVYNVGRIIFFNLSWWYAGGYTEYKDEDSQVIYDVDEERDLIRKAIKVIQQ